MLSFRQVQIQGYSWQSTNFGICFLFWICYLCHLQILNHCQWWFLGIFSIDCFFMWTSLIATINSLLEFNNTCHLSVLALMVFKPLKNSTSYFLWKFNNGRNIVFCDIRCIVIRAVKLAVSDFSVMKKRLHKWIT